jgi:hypothetical protein
MSQLEIDQAHGPRCVECWELVAVLLVGVGALALRLHGIAGLPFWEDELYSVAEAEELFWFRSEHGIFARPLYLVLMNALGSVLPPTHLGLRLPALVFAMGSIGLAWHVARALAGPWGGLVAAVCVSLAPGHLFISTIHRYWSLVFLLGLAFAWLALHALEHDDPRRYRRAFALWLVGAATHPLFLAAAAAVGIGSCVDLRPGRSAWRWPTRRALLQLWLPGLLVLVLAYSAIAWARGSQHFTQIGYAPIQLLQRLRIAPAIAFGLTPIVAAGWVLGAWRLRRSPHPIAPRWAATALVGVPATLALLLFFSGYTPVTAIYASGLTPLLFVAYGGLCAPVVGSPWPRLFSPALLTLSVAAMLPSTVSHLADGGRFDLRPAFDAIRQSDPSQLVVVNPLALARYYAPDLKSVDLPEDGRVERLEALRSAGTPFWLILTERRHGISFDFEGRRWAFASRHCTPWGEYGRMRLDYEMYRVRLYHCTR